MGQRQNGPMTSDDMAKAMRTNPVVARRIMAGLRDAGLVQSEKGHGGGWTLVYGLHEITLDEVYAALGEPPLFALGHRDDDPECLVEQAVNAALGEAFDEAEALLRASFAEVTLDMLSTDVARRSRKRGPARRRKV